MNIKIFITISNDSAEIIDTKEYNLLNFSTYDIQTMILDRRRNTDLYEFKLIAERDK